MKGTARATSLLICCCWCAVSTDSGASTDRPSARQVLSKLQSRYDRIESFSADFTQVYRGHNVEQRESGVLIMAKPGKMYWEYRHPTHKVFVSNGKKAYFYVPRDRQVMETDLQSRQEGTPLLFLLGQGNLLADFEPSFEEQEKPVKVTNLFLRLTPRGPQGEFSRLLLEIDPATYFIYRLSVIEWIGNRTDYILTNVRENIRVPRKRFRFKIPSGTEVIRQQWN
ncbi:MAG: outer membrane lipoprotein chaperone LolA [Acidobacteriota bacterium]